MQNYDKKCDIPKKNCVNILIFRFYDAYCRRITFVPKSLRSYLKKEVLKESGIGYWHDRKGENEIDIVAEDELENKIVFIEVKRKSKNFDEI